MTRLRLAVGGAPLRPFHEKARPVKVDLTTVRVRKTNRSAMLPCAL
jgi:hypothetical protein